MTKRTAVFAALLPALACCAGAPSAEARDLVSPNLAKVVTATFMGTEGSEWLSCGAFLPDGNILVCGVSLEPDLALRGVEAKALGLDAPPLRRITSWRLIAEKETG